MAIGIIARSFGYMSYWFVVRFACLVIVAWDETGAERRLCYYYRIGVGVALLTVPHPLLCAVHFAPVRFVRQKAGGSVRSSLKISAR